MAELNEKTKAILKLIEEEAESFAQRAEMYYRKRPELISMVEDLYRTHRSLAERYDQVRPDSGIRLLTTSSSSFPSPKYQSDDIIGFTDPSYDSCSENCDVEESANSEIDDPEQEVAAGFTKECDEATGLREEIERLREENLAYKDQLDQKDAMTDEIVMLKGGMERLLEENKGYKDQLKQKDVLCDLVLILKVEVGRLKEQNVALKDQLKEKDEEKIEVIRHLSLAVDMLKQENVKMRNFIAKDYNKKWKNPFEFRILKRALSGKLFNGSQWNQPGFASS